MLITVLRILFYQFFLLFIGLSIGFIINAEYIGYKSLVVSRSVDNIFFPKEYDEELIKSLKSWGSYKLWILYDHPQEFTIIEEAILAEEWYWAKFSYKDSKNKIVEVIDSTRLRWKSWEYYYDNDTPTQEELNEYIKNGDLNSQESDRALKLRREKVDKAKT